MCQVHSDTAATWSSSKGILPKFHRVDQLSRARFEHAEVGFHVNQRRIDRKCFAITFRAPFHWLRVAALRSPSAANNAGSSGDCCSRLLDQALGLRSSLRHSAVDDRLPRQGPVANVIVTVVRERKRHQLQEVMCSLHCPA